MTILEIRLFGQISVRQGGQLSGLSSKALELLCYLLLHRERGHTRESLAGILWPEASDAVSKKYLRQAIWQLHSTLTNRRTEVESKALLIMRPGWVRINLKAPWWLDVAAFEKAYSTCRDTPGGQLTDPQAQDLEAAVLLYRGDLAETWYQDWCAYERDRLQLTYLVMLEQLMAYCEARQRYAKGVAYGQSILRYDPARECTYRQLMRLYYRAGDRTTALRQFDRCTEAMAKYFGLQPSRETFALYHQVRTDRLEDSALAAAQRQGGDTGGDLLVGLHARLDHVQASLVAFQHQVQQELASISQVLTGGEGLNQTLCQTP
jgi:DNA-binding SARP family transcriptional activator